MFHRVESRICDEGYMSNSIQFTLHLDQQKNWHQGVAYIMS